MANLKKYKQSGRSMIEMLGVLAIVGVLSAGGIAGYSMAMQSHKTNTLIEKINLIAMQTRKLYKGDYADADIQDLVDAGRIADINNPFGGTIVVGVSNWSTNNNMFHVSMSNIPAETCTDILQMDWGDSGVFEGIRLSGGGTMIDFRNNADTWPPSVADAITSCKAGNQTPWIVFK